MFEKTKYPYVLIFGKYNEALVESLMEEKTSHLPLKDYGVSNIDMVLNHVVHEQVKYKDFRWIVVHRFLSSVYQSHALNQILKNGRFCHLGVIICMEETFKLPWFAKHNISHFFIPKDIGSSELYDIWSCYFREMTFYDLFKIVQNSKAKYIVYDFTKHELNFADNFI